MTKKITLELDNNQAIVLLEIINDFNKQLPKYSAEKIVLSDIECMIEKQLTEPFDTNYLAIVTQAKDTLEKRYYFKKECLIELLKEQEPRQTKIIEQLYKMKEEKWLKQPYIRFVDGKNANKKGAVWQIEDSIVLKHKTEGTIVLDILKDRQIGGFELINELD